MNSFERFAVNLARADKKAGRAPRTNGVSPHLQSLYETTYAKARNLKPQSKQA